ncbi:MAG: PIG-L family deacetylase [Chloroflexi bacterium]|nr:PIG-L family deacetylase [Chloroflexota bacterium]
MSLHVVLSPHPDDAPLTMGAYIHHLTTRGERVLIVTTMAGEIPHTLPDTPVVHEFHTTWDVGDNPIFLRHDEDRAAAAVLGAEVTFLDIADCIYRTLDGEPLYFTRSDVFDKVNPADPVIAVPESLRALVREAGTIYAPLSIGKHVDHQIARGWAEELARDYPGKTILFYTDYPYAEVSGAWEEGLTRVPYIGLLAPLSLNEADLRAKIDSIACYSSQISSFWLSLEDMEARIRAFFTSNGSHPPHERFWEYKGKMG